MTEDTAYEFGIHRLTYPLTTLELILDTRLATLTVQRSDRDGQEAEAGSIIVRLDCFTNFAHDMSFDCAGRNGSSKILVQNFCEVVESRDPPPSEIWREALGDFGFLLLRYAYKRHDRYEALAKDLLLLLGATNASTAWRLSYNEKLSLEHRYQLLKEAQNFVATAEPKLHREGTPLDLPDHKEREYSWWSALRRFQLASEWYVAETYSNPAARQAVRESAANYLQILRSEPSQRDLKRFLAECGTSIEGEVKRLLFPTFSGPGSNATSRSWAAIKDFFRPGSLGGNYSLARASDNALHLAKDEVIRRAFFVWFLQRYDWLSAARLVLADPERQKLKIGLWTLFVPNLIGLFLFIVQVREYPALTSIMPLSLSPDDQTPRLWTAQVLLQLLSLILVLLLAPPLFRLLMPRALFGSLLAWSTIVFTALRDLHELRIGTTELISLCHTANDTRAFAYSLLICLGILMLDGIFIAYTVTQLTEGVRATITRTLSTLIALLLGSLFWGLIFALPIKVALERDSFMFDCSCIVPIVLMGSSVAVLFGLMVELIWQDHSLAEPLGEPL